MAQDLLAYFLMLVFCIPYIVIYFGPLSFCFINRLQNPKRKQMMWKLMGCLWVIGFNCFYALPGCVYAVLCPRGLCAVSPMHRRMEGTDAIIANAIWFVVAMPIAFWTSHYPPNRDRLIRAVDEAADVASFYKLLREPLPVSAENCVVTTDPENADRLVFEEPRETEVGAAPAGKQVYGEVNHPMLVLNAIEVLVWYLIAYYLGVVLLFAISFLIVYFVTMLVNHTDVGVWLVLWFLVTQVWAIALAWLTNIWWTARQQARAAEPVAPEPANQARPTPKELNRRFASWVEHDSQSAGTVLFSSLGIWLSPHLPSALIIYALGMPIRAAFLTVTYSVALGLTFGVMSLPILGAALLLIKGRRFAAQILFGSKFFVCSVAFIGEAAVMLERGASGYPIALMFLLAVGYCLTMSVCLFPRFHSWRVCVATVLININGEALIWGMYYYAKQRSCSDGKCRSETQTRQQNFMLFCTLVGAFTSPIALIELKYRATLKRAHEMTRADASSYDEIWKTFVADESKLKALSGLVDAYKAAMADAERRSKRQAAASVGALFEEAHALQPLVVAKAEAIGGDAGVAYGSTKTVARAFQKAWRSYGGDYRRLCDVVRVSIAFETIEELMACLERIAADDELELIPQGLEKCRFDPDFAPYGGQFVGYRDLQLGATFRSEATRKRGLDQHVVEIQLHLRVFEAIKKGNVTVGLPVATNLADLRMGSGHRTYVACRNLRCS